MCHSSVIIRKHIDLTITLEQHSPAPQTGYLSPGGAGSDEAGSELILGLCCFTPPAALLLSSSLLSIQLVLHLLLLFSSPSPSLLPPTLRGGHQPRLLPQPRALQVQQHLRAACCVSEGNT